MANNFGQSGGSDDNDSLGLLDDTSPSSAPVDTSPEPQGGESQGPSASGERDSGGYEPPSSSPAGTAPPSSSAPDYTGLDNNLVASALSFGMQPEHVSAFRSNPQALQAALELHNRTILGSMFPQSHAPVPFQQMPAQPPMMPMAPPAGMFGPTPGAGPQMGNQPNQSSNPGQAGFQLWKDEAEKAAYNDEFVALMERMNAHYAGQVQALQQQLHAVGGFTTSQAMAQRDAAVRETLLKDHENFDRMIEGLGADYEPLFGRGTHSTIQQNSVYMANRRAVHNAFTALRQAYAQQGLNPDPKTLLNSAAEHVLGQQWQFAQQQARTRGRNGQTTSRPSRGANGKDFGDAAASRFAAQFMRERGLDVGPPSTGEDLGLL